MDRCTSRPVNDVLYPRGIAFPAEIGSLRLIRQRNAMYLIFFRQFLALYFGDFYLFRCRQVNVLIQLIKSLVERSMLTLEFGNMFIRIRNNSIPCTCSHTHPLLKVSRLDKIV